MKRVLNLKTAQLENFWSMKASDFATEYEKKEYTFFNIKSETYFIITVTIGNNESNSFKVITNTAKEAIEELISSNHISDESKITNVEELCEIFLVMDK